MMRIRSTSFQNACVPAGVASEPEERSIREQPILAQAVSFGF
jgi:hypothetical protein